MFNVSINGGGTGSAMVIGVNNKTDMLCASAPGTDTLARSALS